MTRFIMSITARDRAGIVAEISAAGCELGGSIEAASQTVHQGYFAMMVLWVVPDDCSGPKLQTHISQVLGKDAHVYVTAYEPVSAPTDKAKQSFVITSIGPDHAGILAALSEYLSSRDINIDDLYACVKDGEFVVICQVSVPDEQDVFVLQADLEAVGQNMGVKIRMQHENIFVATNELPLRR